MNRSSYVRVNFMLPKNLYLALKSLIPERKRSWVVTKLIQGEIHKREKDLFKIAQSVEKDAGLKKEMKEWDVTLADWIFTG